MKMRVMITVLALSAVPLTAGAQQARGGAHGAVKVRAEALGHERAAAEGERALEVSSKARATSNARLVVAREALEAEGRSATAAEVEAGARALASGAERKDLERIRRRAPDDRSLTASLEALAVLSARGISSAHAAAAVSAHLARGVSDAAITRLAAKTSTATRLNALLGAGSSSGATGGIGAGGTLGGSLGPSLGAGAGIAGMIGSRIRF